MSSIVLNNQVKENPVVQEAKAIEKTSNGLPKTIYYTVLSNWGGGSLGITSSGAYGSENKSTWHYFNQSKYSSEWSTIDIKIGSTTHCRIYKISIPDNWTDIRFRDSSSWYTSDFTHAYTSSDFSGNENFIVVISNFWSQTTEQRSYLACYDESAQGTTSSHSRMYFVPNYKWGTSVDSDYSSLFCNPCIFLTFSDGDTYYALPTGVTTGEAIADKASDSRKLIYYYDNVPLKSLYTFAVKHNEGNDKWMTLSSSTFSGWYDEEEQTTNIYGMGSWVDSGWIDELNHAGVTGYYDDTYYDTTFLTGSFSLVEPEESYWTEPKEGYIFNSSNSHSITLTIAKDDTFAYYTRTLNNTSASGAASSIGESYLKHAWDATASKSISKFITIIDGGSLVDEVNYGDFIESVTVSTQTYIKFKEAGTVEFIRPSASNCDPTITLKFIKEEASIDFARFYFCEGPMSFAESPRIGTKDLQNYWDDATVFSGTSVTSSYAATSFPEGSYYYIDFPLEGTSACYFSFVRYGNNYYKTGTGWQGKIGDSFKPGYIYTITAGSETGSSGNSKWCDITVTVIGYLGYFDLDGGTRNAGESYDYKEFRTSENLAKAPSKNGYTFMGWKSSQNGFVNNADTSYTASSPLSFTAIWVSNTQRVVSGDKTRIWIGYNGNSSQLFYKDKVTIKARINDGSGVFPVFEPTVTYYNPGESIDGLTNCPRRYDCFDIPTSYITSGAALNIAKYDSGGTEYVSNFYYTLSAGMDPFTILYCPYNWDSGSFVEGGLSSTDSLFATIALAGIHTCSDSTLNGSGAFSNYYSTFVQNSTVVAGMSSYQIRDFANLSDYSSDSDITKLVSAYGKYMWVQYESDKGSYPEPTPALGNFNLFGSSSNDDNGPIVLIIVASSLTILSLTSLVVLLVKKRKQQ